MDTHRRIRSFVIRAGRVTAAQERALAKLWPVYGVETSGMLDLATLFGRVAPRCLEIGFGAGEVIGELAERHPDRDYLGIEVHRSGVGRLLLRAASGGLSNVRLICDDAVAVLEERIADDSFDEILIFFPDPWHKKRHHKRRLIDADFAALLAAKLRANGTLRLATDWQDYAEQMLQTLNGVAGLQTLSPDGTFVQRPDSRPPTRFERRGLRLGHNVWDLAYAKVVSPPG